jgi:hypothetical protein
MSSNFDSFTEDDFKDLIQDVKAAGEVPEPSPLFWNHLSARVRDAVAVEPIPRAWWMTYWRPLAVAAGTIGLVAVVTLRPWAPTLPSVRSIPTQPAADLVADVEVSEMWRLIEVAAPSIGIDSARDAGLMPSAYATDQAIESLTPSQREALVKLLRKEMGVSE